MSAYLKVFLCYESRSCVDIAVYVYVGNGGVYERLCS